MNRHNGFFYKGTYYDNEEDFEVAVERYQRSKISRTSLCEMFYIFESDLFINLLQILKSQITNIEMQSILVRTSVWIMNEVSKVQKNTTYQNEDQNDR